MNLDEELNRSLQFATEPKIVIGMMLLIDRNDVISQQAGASIGDVIMSMIATSAEAGVNVLDYFNTVQRMQSEVKAAPQQFLPWNYQSNL